MKTVHEQGDLRQMIARFDELAVEIVDIDDDHKKLAEHLEALFLAHRQGQGTQVVKHHLAALLDVTRVHFAHEVDIMGRNHYPQLQAHRALHGELISLLDDLLEHVEHNPSQGVSDESLGFLQHAMVHHILVEDKKIGVHMGVVY